MALDGSGIAPCRDVWFVGDAGIDMEIAHCCGCVPVLLRSDAAPVGEFDRHPPALRLGSCAELITRMPARTRVVTGKRVSVRVAPGGRRIINHKTHTNTHSHN